MPTQGTDQRLCGLYPAPKFIFSTLPQEKNTHVPFVQVELLGHLTLLQGSTIIESDLQMGIGLQGGCKHMIACRAHL